MGGDVRCPAVQLHSHTHARAPNPQKRTRPILLARLHIPEQLGLSEEQSAPGNQPAACCAPLPTQLSPSLSFVTELACELTELQVPPLPRALPRARVLPPPRSSTRSWSRWSPSSCQSARPRGQPARQSPRASGKSGWPRRRGGTSGAGSQPGGGTSSRTREPRTRSAHLHLTVNALAPH